ncbi:hypothetical protein [Desulfatiglans anilini]|uniref:hypothetical protein n=1 Tax=Desulfatiglans anilini TaxID=90728 RepID=UPI0003FBB6FB|nr:hypothetical protein [Desulfatiglans anilini]
MKKRFWVIVLAGLILFASASLSLADLTITADGGLSAQDCDFNCTDPQYVSLGNPIYNWHITSSGQTKSCESWDGTISFPGTSQIDSAIVYVEGANTTEMCEIIRAPFNKTLLNRFLERYHPEHALCFPNNASLSFRACADPGANGAYFILLESDQCDYTIFGPILLNDAQPCSTQEPQAVPTFNAFGGAALIAIMMILSVIYMKRKRALR